MLIYVINEPRVVDMTYQAILELPKKSYAFKHNGSCNAPANGLRLVFSRLLKISKFFAIYSTGNVISFQRNT